ncbi:hypothetical protein D0Y65_003218, partial [Glycine soja]
GLLVGACRNQLLFGSCNWGSSRPDLFGCALAHVGWCYGHVTVPQIYNRSCLYHRLWLFRQGGRISLANQ